jgi:pimeloyl-ACP methyl ester carboxylesterase
MKHAFFPFRLVVLSGACLLLVGCAQYATVSETKPRFRPASTANPTEQKIAAAFRLERRDPLAALGSYIAAADAAAHQFAKDPHDTLARDDYNFAVARIITTLRDAKLEPWKQPVQLPEKDGGYVLDYRHDPRKNWNPALYRFTPADQFDVKGTYVSKRSTKPGVGAPLVAVGREDNPHARENFVLPRTYYGVTAVANFSGRRCTLSFEDPLAKETTTLQGRTFALAADFTVPIAVMLASTNPKKLELARVLEPEKYMETARIARLQPYDPNKTVVLVIHGLADTPATWAPMLNALRSDETIRKNYQFWFYSYPTGFPYPYSAAILRRELDGIEKKFPLRKKMVLIGHSMGSCISRLLITDAGDKLWRGYFGKPPAKSHFSPETKEFLTESLIFDHRPEVGRVIFISGPHRGSEIASNYFGRFASRLVRAPIKLLKAGPEAVAALVTDGDSAKARRIPNSVDTLAPDNGFVLAINRIPITPGIPYHSIMGDRGKGGNKDHTKPVSSDGVVPYWSSHLDGAQSELIVPSPHSAHQNPQAIAEVERILDAHADR